MGTAAVDGRRLIPADGVRLKLLDEDGIVFDARSRTVYFLNTAATLLWCRIESGEMISPELERIAVPGTAIEPATGGQDIVSRWVALGLLVEPGGGPSPAQPAPPRTVGRRARKLLRPAGPSTVRRHYRLLHTNFALSFGDARLAALVHQTLAHLEVPAPAGDPIPLVIDRQRGRIRLSERGRLLEDCRSPSELAPLVKLALARLAVARFPHRLAVHAAALASAAGCLLLPAAAGSGKSVLSAALMARGWDYLSDDTALLGEESFALAGVAYSLTLKEGAWNTVSTLYPELLRLPVHRRPDGQRVRYLPPIVRSPGGAAEHRVRWIVTPRFASAGPPAELKRLTRAEALQLLLENCGWVRPLDWETIERAIAWLGAIESYSATYSSLAAAIAAIEALAARG